MVLEPVAIADEVDTGFERPGRGRDPRHRPPRRETTDAHDRHGDEESDDRDRAENELHDRSFLRRKRVPSGYTVARRRVWSYSARAEGADATQVERTVFSVTASPPGSSMHLLAPGRDDTTGVVRIV